MYTKIMFVDIGHTVEVWRMYMHISTKDKVYAHPMISTYGVTKNRYKPVVSMNNDPPVVSY